MKFKGHLIDLAIRFKALSLEWEPTVGNYVYDANGIVKASSPFQPGVYFLLNYNCFMERVGGLERFRNDMVWLPTWEDARVILSRLGVSNSKVVNQLTTTSSIENLTELDTLYSLILERLVESGDPNPAMS